MNITIKALALLPVLGLAGLAGPIVPCSTVVGNAVQNCSFETNSLANTSSFAKANSVPAISAASWVFTNAAGISGSGGPWGNGTADGSYTAFLQQYSGLGISTIGQSLVLSPTTNYTLTFYSALRSGGYSADPFNVLYNGNLLGSVTPGSTTPALQSFTFNTATTGTTGTLSFASTATSNGDVNSTIDNVALVAASAVPEPASFLLAAPALAVLALLRRRASVR